MSQPNNWQNGLTEVIEQIFETNQSIRVRPGVVNDLIAAIEKTINDPGITGFEYYLPDLGLSCDLYNTRTHEGPLPRQAIVIGINDNYHAVIIKSIGNFGDLIVRTEMWFWQYYYE